MVTIKDIYQWCDNSYENAPHPPRDSNLTPLQHIEWEKQNAKLIDDYKNRTFVGENLTATPARIGEIFDEKIDAGATYPERLKDCYFKMFPSQPKQNMVLYIHYELFFGKFLYETVKQIYNNSWIEFEGKIISFEYYTRESTDNWESNSRHYILKINLSEIKVINEPTLSPSLLGVKSIPFQIDNSSKCFIATAAFGNQDIIEVIQLRNYRDNVLKKSFAGRCFIFTYSFLSPPIAFVIKQNNWLRRLTRSILRKIILPIILKYFPI